MADSKLHVGDVVCVSMQKGYRDDIERIVGVQTVVTGVLGGVYRSLDGNRGDNYLYTIEADRNLNGDYHGYRWPYEYLTLIRRAEDDLPLNACHGLIDDLEV